MKKSTVPKESKKFVQVLLLVSIVWLGLGLWIHSKDPSQILAFIQIFLFSFLDLIFILLLFWTLFFEKNQGNKRRVNKWKVIILSFFKLVCLGFLAITLKRLRNAPSTVHLMGISIVWIAPLISGVVTKKISKRKLN